jgi:xylulokinase
VASALETPLERVGVDEGAAYGAAILGGVAAGVWTDVREGVAATVEVTETVEPIGAWVEAFRPARERYRSLYPALNSALSSN